MGILELEVVNGNMVGMEWGFGGDVLLCQS